MTAIASPHNPRLQSLRRLRTKRGRAQSGRFFAEGEDLIAAAADAGCAAIEGYRVAGSRVGGARFHDVEPEALAAVSTLGSGTRAIGVYEQRWLQAPVGPVCVYLHGVRDPGNVGAVVRSALAFGAACVALGADCADPFSPKAVRASMGAIFAVQLALVHDPAQLPGERVALVTGAGERLSAVSERLARAQAVSLLVGAERTGIEPAALAACQHVAHIPIATDSLNAAMAATVALYELARARASSPATRAVDQATSIGPTALADAPSEAPTPARPSTQARPSRVSGVMIGRIEHLREQAQAAIAEASSSQALQELRVHYLGRKAELPQLLRGVAQLEPGERAAVGRAANEARQGLEALLQARERELGEAELQGSLASEQIDVTLPGSPPQPVGRLHVLTQTMRELQDIFLGLGFTVLEGPEVETVHYNFDALNHSPTHPARARTDTFYLDLRVRPEGERSWSEGGAGWPVDGAGWSVDGAGWSAKQHGPADPHLTHADKGDGGTSAAAVRGDTRTRVPPGQRRNPHPSVPPARGAGRRRGHHARGPEGNAARVRAFRVR